ncbi:MAG: 3-oxoacyl-ACP synthase III [Candidatus Xenobiia bacterium LiM19]
MIYKNVYLDSIGYVLPPIVMTTSELEERLSPLLEKLHIPEGQIEHLTGISERRWWDAGYPLSRGAGDAARKAIEKSCVPPGDIDIVIYGGVCRESYEPATACRVAASLGINPRSLVYDISNACLGVLNGIIDIANRIALGHSRAGLVVSAETAREINEIAIARMLEKGTMEYFIGSLATLTGGSGAVALLLTDGSYSALKSRRLVGGVACAAPEFHHLCRWGVEEIDTLNYTISMYTDSTAVLKHGVELGKKTWDYFLCELGWKPSDVDRTICHQVGSSHQDTILKTLGIPLEKDFVTFPYLGNIGTVSLPITAAIAEERGVLSRGDLVSFLGIGSGLNCMMMGWEW